jgi:hypothetical protein
MGFIAYVITAPQHWSPNSAAGMRSCRTREQAIQTMLLAQIAQSYCVTQYKQGASLDNIALLRVLPAFWNSANRCLKAYLDVLPSEENVLDLGEAITKAVKEHEQNKE